ncbi:hypothetical protein [Halorientalis persicus]|nr:hypothetical protein [Halorientalis persicus]
MPESDSSDQFELPDSAPVYGSEHVEVGIEDGDGYITISPSRGEPFTFSGDTDEIEAFCRQQQRGITLPEPPEGFEEVQDGPDGWGPGKLIHTGGGIWCRVWERPLDENENGPRIQVLYPVPDCIGVTAELHDSDGYHIGTITDKHVKTELNKIDEHCAKLANDIMTEIDAGEHDETISEITGGE